MGTDGTEETNYFFGNLRHRTVAEREAMRISPLLGVHKRLGISQPSQVNYHGWSSFDPTRPLMSVLPSSARLPASFATSRAAIFFFSFLFVPPVKRRAIESVYA